MAKQIRLDKYLADAGVGTRSEVKKLIQKGKVQINGEIIRKPEAKVTEGDQVNCEGSEIGQSEEFEYYLLYKPAGCVTATEDARDKTVMEYVPSNKKGLFPVGRLDKDTEGLLLITNDGAWAHELLSPKKHVDKTYYARVTGCVTQEAIDQIAEGVEIGDEKPALPGFLKILSASSENDESEILLTIHEGRFHQVKRMMHAVGHEVTYLKRISMGGLKLPDSLKKGDCIKLKKEEVDMIRKEKSI
ncbi:MAG: pseudouridine synthase [Eubacteriales bacterium]|nr:pseudouridine synthase [Eubacteriales bacterium]